MGKIMPPLNEQYMKWDIKGGYWYSPNGTQITPQEMLEYVAQLETEVEDWEKSFDMYHDALIRGTKKWKEAHPEVDYFPDTAEMMAWFINRDEQLEAENERLREASRGLVNNLPELEIEVAREAWGNTNTNVILHWRNQVLKALGGS